MLRATPIAQTTSVADLLAARPYTAAAFVTRGMACPGCPMARYETLAEAAAACSVDLVALLADIARMASDSTLASRRVHTRKNRPGPRH